MGFLSETKYYALLNYVVNNFVIHLISTPRDRRDSHYLSGVRINRSNIN